MYIYDMYIMYIVGRYITSQAFEAVVGRVVTDSFVVVGVVKQEDPAPAVRVQQGLTFTP